MSRNQPLAELPHLSLPPVEGVPDYFLTFPATEGRTLLLRPIRPEDGDTLKEGVKALSARSKYWRFMDVSRTLSDEDVAYLTQIDYCDHMAWAAFLDGPQRQTGIGVARYVRLGNEPSMADFAVVVIDRYQGHGIGSRLMGALIWSAMNNDITQLRSTVLADNAVMLRLTERLGGSVTPLSHGIVQVDIPLAGFPGTLPDQLVIQVYRRCRAELDR
jgi:RimJ/RimL family protein N-acetyltransferase